jgi:ribosome-associated heat shock protein Hsp15
MHDRSAPVRVDRWLWAARLVKTRTLGADAARGGRVHVNGIAVKPSKEIHVGDRLELTTGPVRRTVVVRGTAQRRGPASEAVTLYEETAESREARERLAQERRLAAPAPVSDQGGRPTKRDRRRFESTARSHRRER